MVETSVDVETRLAILDLYAAYVACLDDQRFEEWPAFFTGECCYRIVPRENYERGLPLSLLAFESRGMLEDRVYSITHTLFHAPYYQRHCVSNFAMRADAGGLRVSANYLVLRTKRGERSEVYSTGRCLDRIVRADDGLRFAEKVFVADSELIPNSLIYPL